MVGKGAARDSSFVIRLLLPANSQQPTANSQELFLAADCTARLRAAPSAGTKESMNGCLSFDRSYYV